MSDAVAHLTPLQPSQSLIKSICYPSLFSATTNATANGIKYESEAVRAYAEEMKVKNINFKVTTKRYCCSYC